MTWLPKSYEPRGGPTAAASPEHLQPAPERTPITPAAGHPQEKPHNIMSCVELALARARKLMQTKPLATLGTLWAQASKLSIWGRDRTQTLYLVGFCDTLQNNTPVFLCKRCWEITSASLSPSWLLLYWQHPCIGAWRAARLHGGL